MKSDGVWSASIDAPVERLSVIFLLLSHILKYEWMRRPTYAISIDRDVLEVDMNTMAPMVTVETGIPELDTEHGKIAELLIEVVDISRNNTGIHAVINSLVKLKLASEQHFLVEDALMAAAIYHDSYEHKLLHRNQLVALERLIDDIKTKLEAPDHSRIASLAIWFAEHMRTVDMELAESLKRRRYF